MKAYVLLNIHAGDIASVIQHMKRVEGVKESTMTFGPYDGVAVIEAEDLKAIGMKSAFGGDSDLGNRRLPHLATDISP